jgi:hypothetical protein
MVNFVDFKPLAPHRCGFESDRDFGLIHVKKLSSWLRERRWFYSGARFCQKKMHRRAPA